MPSTASRKRRKLLTQKGKPSANNSRSATPLTSMAPSSTSTSNSASTTQSSSQSATSPRFAKSIGQAAVDPATPLTDPSMIAAKAKDLDLPPVILQTAQDIAAIKIQGATNVAVACFEALKEWTKQASYQDWDIFYSDLGRFGGLLVNARPNEPLAKNGLKFILSQLKICYSNNGKDVGRLKEGILELSQEFLEIISISKKQIIQKALTIPEIAKAKTIFTHCHSSTAESVIKQIDQKQAVKVIATETRPRYQGRITTKNLVEAGIDTTMIVDSAAPYFITNDDFMPVDVVFLGADQITYEGDALNKIGSFGMGLSAYFASKPLYVVTPALKLDLSTIYTPVKVELRKANEIWPEAPRELDIINPAFDIIEDRFISGFLTEFGLVKPQYLADKVRRKYEWLT